MSMVVQWPVPAEPDTAVSLVDAASERVALHWQERITTRIAEQINKELRAGLPLTLPSTEQAAMAMLKTIAGKLRDAGDALHHAAEALKHAGKGLPANQAHKAYLAAQQAANEIIGDDNV